MPQLAAVHSLLTLLSEVDLAGDAASCAAAAPRPSADELAEYSIGLRLKQQLLARRADRLARFLRLQLPAAAGSPGGGSGGRSPARGATLGSSSVGSQAAGRHHLGKEGRTAARGYSPHGRPQFSPGEAGRVQGTRG